MTDKPDLTRVWAEDAPSGNIVDPDLTTPGKFAAGWQAEVPPFEHFNFIQKLQTEGLAHINEQGIAVWDNVTVYPIGALAKGSDGNVYKAITYQANNDPVTDGGTNWIDWEVSNRVIRATSIAAMEAYSAPVGYVFSLNAGGRSGVFDVIAGDFSTELAADTLNGVYVGLADDPTASTKVAKRRLVSSIIPEFWGAVGNGVADDTAAFVQCCEMTNFIELPVVCNAEYLVVDATVYPENGFTLTGKGSIIYSRTASWLFSLSGKENIEISINSLKTFGGGNGGGFVIGTTVKRLKFDVEFVGACAPGVYIRGDVDEWSENLYISCTSYIGNGTGSLVGLDFCKFVTIENSYLENSGEGLDINNYCDKVLIRNLILKNCSENYLDVNGSHNVTIENVTILDESVSSNRMCLFTDGTSATFPAGLDDKYKHCDNIVVRNLKIISDSFVGDTMFDITHGARYQTTGYIARFNITDLYVENKNSSNIDASAAVRVGTVGLLKLKLKNANVINQKVSFSKLRNSVVDGLSLTYTGTSGDRVGIMLFFSSCLGVNASNIMTIGYAPSPANEADSGIAMVSSCELSTFYYGFFDFTTVGYALFTSSSGGTNRYIYNLGSTDTTDTTGVRSNPGDTVIYT